MLKNVQLRDYQVKTLRELAPINAIGLFIKTGGGKSIMSLARCEDNPTDNILVICPQKIITQWYEVIKKHTDYDLCEYNISYTALKKNKIINEFVTKNTKNAIVVNYDIISNLDLDFINDNWTIILDESHKIKNNYKIHTKGEKRGEVKSGYTVYKCLSLSERTPYKIILTATPAEKQFGGYIDYYTQLKFLGYIDYNETLFKNRFCILVKTQRPGMPFPRTEISGYRTENIDNEIKPILKTCCRFYAPKYNDFEAQKIKVEIDKAPNYAKFLYNRAYEEISVDNTSAFRVAKKTLTGGKITGTDEYGDRYDYIDNYNKADWLEEFLSNTDDVVSILYNYNVEKDMIEAVCKKLKKKYILINGDVKNKPEELKKDFDVMIGQFKAAGESLDGLQNKCHIMVYYSMPDSSEQYTQSLGRIDRIGQEFMPAYYHLVMKSTVDDKVYDMLEKKIQFTSQDLDELTVDM